MPVFFDDATGWFYDRTLSGQFINVKGAEGWLPMWAGVATQQQAATLRDTMMNPAEFNTVVPLPTVSASEPKFDPTGYWRGPVWLDQSFFGIVGLKQYGYTTEATTLAKALLGAQGLIGDDTMPTYEYYNPLTREAQGAPFFGWSASHILLLLNSV
eukprot:TRINITY_DN734_c0_g1_i2.p1 TRINITY_DN734_c0_g1~~TRINITY_DN734_c0_g1_i2.p1  ORF type:complete len:156 (+),score=25.38 TRINITY_DN734_c0_g1_i2:235-702(+)